MKNKKQLLAGFLSGICLFLLMIDTKTAISGTTEGIEICLKVIIPSLFPFLLVTSYMNTMLTGIAIPGLNVLSSQLHIPAGCEHILLLGLIGGYPVGARMIGQTYAQGKLDKQTGQILLGYCNNAGPAFIFGLTGVIFSNAKVPFLLWGIQLLSAIITGFILPKPKCNLINTKHKTTITLTDALTVSIGVSTSICGWIIVFKVIISYISKYLSPICGETCILVLSGILELSNGCLKLQELNNESVRFVLCSSFCTLGGLCVALQTLSVTGELKLGFYLPGKVIQTCISILLAIPCALFLYPKYPFTIGISLPLCICCVLIIIFIKPTTRKKLWKSEQISCIMQTK